LVHEPVDVAAVVDDVRRDLGPQFKQAGAQLLVEVAACPSVRFSVKNLRSVVYNLLSNALKYHHPTRVPQIRLACAPSPDGRALLTVQDNGLGLTPAQQQQLFRMFHRLHTHVEGTGIGLYMIKKMVENAGGTISVESEVGVGSTFTVALPA
jgi:signal transduction histidine kinase